MAWDRAERYRRLMAEGGHTSVRALARDIGEAEILRMIESAVPSGMPALAE